MGNATIEVDEDVKSKRKNSSSTYPQRFTQFGICCPMCAEKQSLNMVKRGVVECDECGQRWKGHIGIINEPKWTAVGKDITKPISEWKNH
jgi:ribosomal protein L37AE/L43A